ncbi:sulfotransferase 1A1-like [Haliotis rufescens]|uniref:sulfotransferase 1A1-like n=1 Tax=Haliotis rufescens TaxID=6454 RepID=UPI00201EABF4|nr:sulfotransferase 1A1-like [Haliotis rufescens]
MTTISLKDDGGDELLVISHNGCRFPNFPNNRAIENMASVKIRSDDVILSTYSRSGTHWVWEMSRLLQAGKLDTSDIDKTSTMLELSDEEVYKDLPSPRLLNSHAPFQHLPDEVKVKKPKIVHVIRNPKDAIVSYFVFMKKIGFSDYSGKWENYLRPATEGRFEYGSWFDHFKSWEEVKNTTDIPILTLHYEDLKEDTFREAKKLCDFLGVERSDDFIRQVCEQCEFNSMKKIKATAKLTGKIAYRKGEVGDWKNWFTLAQNEWFDQFYAEQMKDCPVKVRFTLD